MRKNDGCPSATSELSEKLMSRRGVQNAADGLTWLLVDRCFAVTRGRAVRPVDREGLTIEDEPVDAIERPRGIAVLVHLDEGLAVVFGERVRFELEAAYTPATDLRLDQVYQVPLVRARRDSDNHEVSVVRHRRAGPVARRSCVAAARLGMTALERLRLAIPRPEEADSGSLPVECVRANLDDRVLCGRNARKGDEGEAERLLNDVVDVDVFWSEPSARQQVVQIALCHGSRKVRDVHPNEVVGGIARAT